MEIMAFLLVNLLIYKWGIFHPYPSGFPHSPLYFPHPFQLKGFRGLSEINGAETGQQLNQFKTPAQ